MKSNTETNKFSTLEKIIFFGLLILIVVNIVNRVFSSPFDYDEGVGLILTKIIFQTGKYSSYESAFDYIITVGPTVYFPAAMTLVFGNLFFPRLIISAYSLLFIYFTTKIFTKNISKVFFLFLLCLTPYFFYFSSHVLGEIPALFFSITGLYFLDKKRFFLSGTLLALSIITKNVFVLSLAPALYIFVKNRKNISLDKIFIFMIPFFLIGAGWELYKFQAFQFSIERYMGNLYMFLKHNRAISEPHFEYIPGRLSMLTGTFGVNGILLLIFMVLISLYTFFKNNNNLLKSIAIYTLVYLLYFFLFGATVWYRHLFPSVVLFIIVLADSINIVRLSKLSIIPISIAIFSLFIPTDNTKYIYKQNLLPLFDQVGTYFLSKSDILTQQLKTAEYIKSKVQNDSISGVVWYNAPEISYLSDKQILRIPEDKKAIYLISHPFGRLLVPSIDARISEYPFKVTVFETQLYSIYKKYE